MAETLEQLTTRLRAAIAPGYRERLLDRGLAREMIWSDGTLPVEAPSFAPTLTEDLLDYGHAVLYLALRTRGMQRDLDDLRRAFLVAGEALEAAVHHGDPDRIDRGFNRISAAVALHLGSYSARAYSVLGVDPAGANLAPTELALSHLIRRALDDLNQYATQWLSQPEHDDAAVAQRLRTVDADFDAGSALHITLTRSFMRALILFDSAIVSGDEKFARASRDRLFRTAEAAQLAGAVNHWWTALLAGHLTEELWQMSLHRQIPLLANNRDAPTWNRLRLEYIHRLRRRKRSSVELWPSQIEAAHRAVDETDDLVVAVPTSAGKTRIAELCILRALASGKRVVYVTPLRALSAQVERDLAGTFGALGFSVSSLYGSAGTEIGDAMTLREGAIVVATPEKLDFALRNDYSIINDVGLVILDEGHMLGPNEREIRYEALVQRLLRRGDASARRVVCLSALFPPPDKMQDLVAWIRQDEPGNPVHSSWRPTRQRFCVLTWLGGRARLDAKVEEENPFVPRFIEARTAPSGSRRRTKFPNDKNELTLAAAWRFVEQKKEVLIYCPLRKSVETLGREVLSCVAQGVLTPLIGQNDAVREAMAAGAEWLGADHVAVKCLEHGVALHHGGLPRPFLTEVERLLRSGVCPITIASPTLAQGLNLSASVLLVPSIWRNREVIPASEFANISGRAGRAFVDLEGLIVHVVWEKEAYRRQFAISNWNELVGSATASTVTSGLLILALKLFSRIAEVVDVPVEDVIEYISGHTEIWDSNAALSGDRDWEMDVASMDTALLSFVDPSTEDDRLSDIISESIAASLFTRQLAALAESTQEVVRSLLEVRARHIWSLTTSTQRRGYYVAGVGLGAGKFIDSRLDELVSLLLQTEGAVLESNREAVLVSVLAFAEIVFQVAPFKPPSPLPEQWRQSLTAWIGGGAVSMVVAAGGDDGIDLLQEAITYRLPWAMEAVRVHAVAVDALNAELLQGWGSLAVESGSYHPSVITLLRNGLVSRDAAATVVEETSASFSDRNTMRAWLESETATNLGDAIAWPTEWSRRAWERFYRRGSRDLVVRWAHHAQAIDVEWLETPPAAGVEVMIVRVEGGHGEVMSLEFGRLGLLARSLERSWADVVSARVTAGATGIEVQYFGPSSRN